MQNDMRNFIAILFLSMLIITSCKNEHQNHQAPSESYYTCPMHPTVVKSTPGSCPVCNMSLIKVEKKENQHSGQQGNFITLTEQQQELAGIITDTVKVRDIALASAFTGTVAIDEAAVKTISSRVKGRIHKLFIKTTGMFLQKGTPLYSIYSEQLQADETEYLSLLEKLKTANNTSQVILGLADAAKNKLLLWGMSEEQINELAKSHKVSPQITFFLPEGGYVTKVNIVEGMYVEEGSPVVEITSLNEVWVEAQLYANETTALSQSKTFRVYHESSPEEVYHGKLVYNNPIIEEGKRVHLLKIRINNSGGKLIPGTLVSVVPEKSFSKVLAVPKSAVLLEKMKTLWVLTHANTFEQRMVKTGIENKEWIEIISGLKPGDIVVTEGAYLISSEFILKSGAAKRHDH